MPKRYALFTIACHGSAELQLVWEDHHPVKLQCAICGADLIPLKDEAPGVGPGASGVESTGCSPPAPISTGEDTPPQSLVTDLYCEHGIRRERCIICSLQAVGYKL